MSHTAKIPAKFMGSPVLTDRKLFVMTNWYQEALADSGIATEPEEAFYYTGMADGLSDALRLIYDMGSLRTEVVVEEIEKVRRFKKPLVILGVGAGIYVLWNYSELKAKVKGYNEKLRAQARADENKN